MEIGIYGGYKMEKKYKIDTDVEAVITSFNQGNMILENDYSL